jgi:hypothetical protein
MRSHDLWTRWFSESRANYDALIAERSAAIVAKAADRYSLQEVDELLRRFIPNNNFTGRVSEDAVERCEAADDEDLAWLIDALRDQQGKWFVASVAGEAKKISDALFAPMLLAGIDEGDPSGKKYFVVPWARVGRIEEAAHFLMDQFERQPGPRRISVLGCLYFASGGMPTTEEGRQIQERKFTMLTEAVSTEADVATRCRMLEELAGLLNPYGWHPEITDSLHRRLRQIAESLEDNTDPETRQQHTRFAQHLAALSIKRAE